MTNVVYKGITHLNFLPMQALYNLINDKIQDINAVRRAKPTPRERQWIYPSMPEANDENYPRIALITGNVSFSEYGTSNYVRTEYTGGMASNIVYARVATLPVNIIVYVKKRQRHDVVFYDGTIHTIQNTKQADFLGDKIAKFIEMYRKDYFIVNNMDIRVISISRTYDDGDFLYSKNIYAEIVMFDDWKIDLTDPMSMVGIIRNINTNWTIDPVVG